MLQEAFSRCVSVLSHSTKQDEVAVQVCSHIAKCYGVAAQFEGCRERIQEHSAIVKDLCRILYYRGLPRLCADVTVSVSSFAVDLWLQTNLLKSGVLWHLLLFLFNYDYTLEEGGVEKSESSNQQVNLTFSSCCDVMAPGSGQPIGETGSPRMRQVGWVFAG